jgi:uncharacterized protein YcaQ
VVTPRPDAISAREARWLAVSAQDLGGRRVRRAGGARPADIASLVRRIGIVQLDAINIVERAQFIALFSRLGPFDKGALHRLTGPGGSLWEYWGHAASLMPVEDEPLLRWRMGVGGTYHGGPKMEAYRKAWEEAHRDYLAAVLDEVRERGPLTGGQLQDPRRRDGEWWERRSVGREALEWLFTRGHLAAWRTPAFERVYDLPERVLPRHVLEQPTPPIEEAHRALLLRAAAAYGVATTADLAGYYMLQLREAKPRVAELVEAGELVPVDVEGWNEPAYVLPGTRARRPARAHATLLSPFDSLVWDRKRAQRLFGFDYRIEVYVPGPKRVHGYYVLPLLVGDQLVARFDLKADRQASVLRVHASHVEGHADVDATAAAAAAELDELRRWLGLDTMAVARRGRLAKAVLAATDGAAASS